MPRTLSYLNEDVRRAILEAAGERNPASKLTWKAVRKIKSSSATCVELAELYGVTPATISRIKLGRTWNDEATD